MKRNVIVLIAMFCGILGARAQQENDEIQMVQAMWGMEKRTMVSDYMKFTDAEAAAFWPLYDAFQTDLRKLGSDRIMVINDYAKNLSSLSNEKADELIGKVLKNNMETDKLFDQYYLKMKKAITPLRAGAYMQLEFYILTMIRAEIQGNIPLIGELDKKVK